uniref:Epiplakin 1 n=1 Tax=Erpetoichthys calabaricus TaxID=27687 RepID=A0A8C4STD1_ERPCA
MGNNILLLSFMLIVKSYGVHSGFRLNVYVCVCNAILVISCSNLMRIFPKKISNPKATMEHKQKQNEDSGFTIQGIRKSVSVNVLLQAGIIDNQILEKLNNGKLTVEDLSQNHDINKFLDSACCISGIMFKSKKEKMSIYQAMKKKVLTEDNALNLLEAQAATGFMIEPIHNKRYTVQQAVDEGVLGQELQQKMLDAEKAVTGYTDPKTGNTITLFQAMKLGLVNKDFGLRLLETQLATGGIIDPMNSIRIPVEMAWKKGYFSEELNKDLSENGKDCNGYHDPQTKKKTSYRQLLKQCVKDEKTGLHLLPIDINFRGLRRQVTAEELLSSSIITKDLYEQLHEGKTNVEEVSGLKSVQNYLEGTSPIAGVYIESSNMKMNIYQAKQKGLIMPGTSLVLLEAQMATGFLIDVVQNTKHTVEEAINKGLVGLEMKTKLIKAEKAVTGYDDPYTGEKISLFQALKKGLIVKEHGIRLLEAQIATGGIIDPVNSHRVPVEVAYQKGYFDEEMNRILSDPTDDTKGFFDPNTKENLTYLQLLERCRKDNKTGLYLLNLTKKGEEYFYFDEKSKIILKSITTKAPGRYNGQEVNIWELLHSEYITEEKRRELMKNLKSNLCTIEDIQNIVITIIHNTSTNASQQDKKIKTSNGTERDKHLQFDENTMSLLKSTTTDKAGGKYQGKTVSAWELLHSEYITEEKRRELMQKLKQKTLTIDNLLQILISTIQENTVTTTITSTTVTTIASTPTTTETTVRAAFQGLRAQVSPIDQGIVTVEAVSQQDSVKRYLQGTDSIAGVFIPSTKEKMSIYQAMKKGILRPGTALVLLEAQAATGFVIDPVKNTKLSVEEAVAAGLVGRELKDKLLSAERAVTGYTDPYTGDTISLFQSLKKDLIVKDHGIRLLEAQIATGGIIDPVHSHRVPVEVAYQRGYFDEEMSQILSDPSDDTKGFFDPNTHENLTYLQLLERCTKDPDTGLCLLNLVKKGEGYVQIDAQTTSLLKSTTTDKAGGKYQGKTVSAWELLHSEYITEEKRRELMQKLKQKTLTIDNLLQILISTIQEKTVTTTITSTTVTTIASTPTTTETTVRAAFQGLRAQVSPAELLSSKIIDEETFDKIDQGIVTVEAVSQQDSVKRYLQGTDSIAGVFIPSTKEKMSIYQAMKKGILRPGTALVLLEAQAATGFVIDPVKNTKLSVEEAVAAGLVGRELKDKLLSAERAVTGYTDPYTGDTISLFQSLKKDLIVKDHGIRLLEAQIATGGIIDPVHSHRVPVEVAYQRGYFDEEMSQILSDPSDDTKGFFDPNTHENLTYLQLLERCTKDPDTGLCLLNLVKKGEGYVQIDAQTTSLLKSTTTDKAGGKYQGKTVSAWELLHSEYITEEKRRELMQKLKQKTLTIDNLLQILISTIQEKTVTTTITSTTVTTIASTPTTTETTVRAAFQGLRAQVSPAELLSSKIIDEETFDKIDQGIVTVEAVSQQDSVKRYLQGTDSIAGVFIPSTKEKMSIYQAMKKGILRPGTALVLLEAQAATGFVIDPVKNTKLSVEEAVAAGLVGRELKDKLLSAERAVTGYTDPYTGDTISLFQSLKKDLIVKDHGIRLLEAQIATGGIIDPVHSHRVPVEVAYQRGYFDEEMSQILSDPSDDTKGFFDPNTHENLTYLQLLERCTKDPDTGLCLLNLVKKGEGYVQIDAQTTSLLKSTTTDKAGGKYQGKTVSAWELLHSEYITEEKRRELIEKLKQKTLTIDNLLQILISTIQEKTVTTTITSTTVTTIASTPTTTETTVRAAFQGLRAQVSPAELLSSKIIDEETFDKIDQGIVTVEAVSQQDSVKRYLQGTDSIAGVFIPSTKEKMSIYQAMKKGILRPGTALVLLEAQAATGFVIDPVKNTKLSIATGGIIDPVHSHRVPVEVAYQRGYFDEEMSQILSDPSDDTKGFFDPNTHENLTYLQLLERCTKDPDTGLCLLNLVKKGEGYVQIDAQTTSLLKSTTTDKAGGKYQGKTVSAWELLHSEYITEEKRRELMQKLKQKTLTIDNLLQILISTIQEKTVTTTITSTTVTTIASTPTTTETTVRAAFQGLRAQVSPAELLSSKIIDEETFDKIDQGIVTVEAVSQQDSVKRYLQGTDSIAGVFIPSTKEKMSIYQAMKKGILRPGTALVLLEAQAATGFVIDPVKNTKLSVEEAVAAGLVGRELKDKLLSAERAVTGYTDPYTGDTISLFQSLKKDLIVKDHGIRLLEAQIATGGIIDPVHSHRVPVEVAYQRGYFDEEMSQILSDPSDDTKGFFDPNTHENLTYLQLLERCTKDPDTGLCLLNLVKKGEGYVQIDAQTTSLLKSTTTDKAGGKYQGKTVSLKQKTLTIDNLLQILISTIQEKTVTTTITSTTVTTIASTPTTTETTVRAAFQGLRAQVSPAELLSSKIIDEETFDKIDQGIVTVEAVSQQDSVKRYLQGTDSIAGVFIPSTKEKMSIYQAMKKGILRPGTALVLLEAQAATGFVIDPVKNTKLSVEEAVAAGLVGRELKDKLLSAERAVTGYTDPYTGDTISLFQSLKKDLIVKDHGIRLLEAQIATGGIIDPVHSHRVPVEVAYQRGYFDEEMSQILSDPSDDTKGFFDPNTHENLTYLQLLERCTKDPDTGLCLLNLVKKGEGYVQIDAQTTSLLKSTTTDKAGGKYQGKTVSAWELLHSEYITEEKRRELMQKLKQKTLTIDNLLQILISTIQENTVTTTITSTTVTTIASTPTTTETTVRAAFQGLRAQVSPAELLSSKIIDEETFDKIDQGIVTVEAVSQQDSVKRYLQGTDSIAGVFIPSTKEKMSIYQAMKKGILRPGTALVLLEAQAATGFVIDPVKTTKLSVEEAVAAGLVGRELKDKLLSAERAVTGYTDPYTGDTISLFQSLKKDLIVKDHGIRLLEAQIATGGIIDPVHSHRVPVEVAYQRGYFDEEMSQILSDPSDDTKGFFDPNTHENLTYLQLLERCTKDPDTGLCLLNLVKKGEGYVQIDAQTTSLLKSTTTDKAGGKYQGKTVSAWELLHSEYITEEKRRELMQKLKQKTLTIDNLLQILISTIQEKTVTTTITSTTVTTIASTPTTTETTVRAAFQGLRAQVSPAELLSSKIIDEETFDKIDQGIVTVEAVSQQDSVKRYLQGTDSIAGVFIPSTKEKMSIYQAMKKGILRPGTALVLLEAQAATGFVIDPVKNTKLSVEEAVAAGLVGRELKDKLLSAERAVTGYTDPYTGDTISLFQSLKKDLIVKDHGIRLLEAQIATGGIIDPVHSHRVPVEVAYQRGYFDEEMSQILSDPSDDTKGFFDPNTHENLTYLQLLERCTKDPDTGLCLLNLVKKGEGYVQIDAQTTSLLKSTTTDKAGGKYQGKTVSAWELLHSEYITEEKRRELIEKLKQKTLTIDNLLQILISTIQEKTVTTTITSTTVTTIASTPTTTETTVRAAFQGLRAQVSPAELLSSKIIDEETFDKIDQGIVTVEAVSQQDSVKRYLQGTDSIAGVFIPSTKEKMSIYQAMKKGILRPGTALVLLEAQAATGFVIDPVKNTKLSVEEAVAAGLVGRQLKAKLLSAERAVTGYTDPYTGDTISLFQALKKDLIVKDHGIRLLEAQIATGGIIDPVHSHRVPVEVAYQRGYFDEEMSQILSDPSDDTKGFFDPNTHENLTYLQLLERCTKDPDTGLCLLSLKK